MPDFRARVHRGETFVIAGDRFAIGSSREMSPAGLKAIAEEVGLEMVIVCGNNMGDIFRRNAFNLGLHVVQSPEAVADAQDGDEFTFDPESRADRQRHAGQDLHARAAQRQGRRDPPERRHLRRRPARVPRRRSSVRRRSMWPDAERARAHDAPPSRSCGRTASTRTPRSCPARRCASTPTCCRRPTAPRRSRSTPSTRSPAATRSIPRQAAVANDHFVFTGKDDDDKQTGDRPAVRARSTASRSRTTRRPATASSISIFRSRGWCCPGSSSPAPTRTAAPTAPTARSAWASDRPRSASAGPPATSTSRWPSSAASCSPAGCSRGSRGKDIVLELLRRWGAKQSQGMSVELVDADRQLPMAYPQHDRQHDGGSRSAERHLRARRDHLRVVPRQGHDRSAVSARLRCGADAVFEIDEELRARATSRR